MRAFFRLYKTKPSPVNKVGFFKKKFYTLQFLKQSICGRIYLKGVKQQEKVENTNGIALTILWVRLWDKDSHKAFMIASWRFKNGKFSYHCSDFHCITCCEVQPGFPFRTEAFIPPTAKCAWLAALSWVPFWHDFCCDCIRFTFPVPIPRWNRVYPQWTSCINSDSKSVS